MFKKKQNVTKIAAFLMAFSPIALTRWWICGHWIGEPQLPKKMLKEDVQLD